MEAAAIQGMHGTVHSFPLCTDGTFHQNTPVMRMERPAQAASKKYALLQEEELLLLLLLVIGDCSSW
jgi:hypothetical protein